MSCKVFLSDNQAVFRAGAARLLATEDDVRITGQCDDPVRLDKALESSIGTVFLFAASLAADLPGLVTRSREGGNRLVAILELGDRPQLYLKSGIPGIVYRDVSRPDLVRCVRTVARGASFVQTRTEDTTASLDTDEVGERARHRLTPKELKIVNLIVQGYKNKDIAEALNNSEQVVKNCLRTIFDKTGVSDRLELALFTIHHRILFDAADQAYRTKGPQGTPFLESKAS